MHSRTPTSLASLALVVLLVFVWSAHTKGTDALAIPLSASNATDLFAASALDDIWVVEFYSPGCGHCRQFAKSYDSVAEQLHAESAAFHIAKVDVTRGRNERAWFRAYSLPGFPSFVRIEKKHPKDPLAKENIVHIFSGRRSVETLVAFARQAEAGATLAEWQVQRDNSSGNNGANTRAKIAIIASVVFAVGATVFVALKALSGGFEEEHAKTQ